MTTTTTPPGMSFIGMPFWKLGSTEDVWAAGRGLAAEMRHGYGSEIGCLHDLIARGALETLGKRVFTERVATEFRISHADAQRWLRTALKTMPRPGTLTEPAEPELPAMAKALADGTINPTHMRLVENLMDKLSAGVNHDTFLQMEKVLADTARVDGPDDLKPLIEDAKQVMEQNTPPDEEKERAHTLPQQNLWIRELGSGSSKISGILGPESTMELKKALAAFNKPRPSTDEGPDPRTTSERDGDALAEFIHTALNAGALPIKGGTRPHIAVSLRFEDLKKICGKILLDGYGVTSPEVARRLACNADVLPTVLGAKSQILDVAANQRSAPPKLRRVLHQRDKGCAFPSCDRRVEYTEPHHIQHWALGGKTVLDNLVCLCFHHHKIIHFGEWECHMKDGIPWFIPPEWLDPRREPRRNNRFILRE